MIRQPKNNAEWYDRLLTYILNRHLSRDIPWPQPTSCWPPENVEILEAYSEWRLKGGASELSTRKIYVPTAAQLMGLALKPHQEFDLAKNWLDSDQDTEFSRAYDFVLARNLSNDRIDVHRYALENFRKFLCQERGILEVTITPYDPVPHVTGLPEWLVDALKRYQLIRQRNWRPARLEENIRRFWSGHLRTWRFLCGKGGVRELKDLQRKHVIQYMEFRLKGGYAVSGINGDLRALHGFLGFFQEQGCTIPQVLFRIPGLKDRQRLPKFLTDEQVRLLRDDFEKRVRNADKSHKIRDALLDRATFYLLWQAGLRIGEVEELQLEDLNLENRKLFVHSGKSLKDRTVYLTDTAIYALRIYLEHRGAGITDHLFLYRNRALCKDLVRDRIKAAGRRTGVKVYPHRLRHTCATQLLNAGCRVPSIQQFLGHKRLNTTMVYARIHDHKVAEDYYAAMEEIEKRLSLSTLGNVVKVPIRESERLQLLSLTDQLTDSSLKKQERLEVIAQMRFLLTQESVLE